MITGTYVTDDGVVHSSAVAKCYPLIIQTSDSPYASFDVHIFHNSSALSSKKREVMVITLRVEGADLLPFITAAKNAVNAGGEIIDSIVAQMETYTLAQDEFSGWSVVS